jgi:hypothetical protein
MRSAYLKGGTSHLSDSRENEALIDKNDFRSWHDHKMMLSSVACCHSIFNLAKVIKVMKFQDWIQIFNLDFAVNGVLKWP